MDPNSSLPVFTFVFGKAGSRHTTEIAFVDEDMAVDYAQRKLKELHRSEGWTNVSVARGAKGSCEAVSSWNYSDDDPDHASS